MQKWEYCVITGVDSSSIGVFKGQYPKLNYFGFNGISQEVDLGNSAASKRPKGWEKVGEGGYIAYTIAKLGSEGWEMVGTGTGSSMQGTGTHCIYFKRPIEQVVSL